MTPLEADILAAVRRIANSHADNEATSMPAWWITTPRFGSGDPGVILSSVLGPFWSREAAEDWLKTKGYRFTKKSKVFCGSLHDNPELRKLYELSRRMGKAKKPIGDIANRPAWCQLVGAALSSISRTASGPFWSRVMDCFAVDSATAADICREFGRDPETGETL